MCSKGNDFKQSKKYFRQISAILAEAAITKHHKLGGLSTTKIYFCGSAGWKSKVSVLSWPGLVLMRTCLLSCRWSTSPRILPWWKRSRAALWRLTGAVISFRRASPSWPNQLPPQSPNFKYHQSHRGFDLKMKLQREGDPKHLLLHISLLG